MNRLTGTAPEGATRHGLIETRGGNVLGGGRTVFTSSVTQTERVEQGDTAYQTSHAATLSLAMDSVNDAPPATCAARSRSASPPVTSA